MLLLHNTFRIEWVLMRFGMKRTALPRAAGLFLPAHMHRYFKPVRFAFPKEKRKEKKTNVAFSLAIYNSIQSSQDLLVRSGTVWRNRLR